MTQAQRDNLLIAIAHLLLSMGPENVSTEAWARLQIALEEVEGKKRVM